MNRKIVYFIQIFIKSFNTNLKTKTMNLENLFNEIDSLYFELAAYDCFGKKVMFFDMQGRLVNGISFTNIQRAFRYAIALAISKDFSNYAVSKFEVLHNCYIVNTSYEINPCTNVAFCIENHK